MRYNRPAVMIEVARAGPGLGAICRETVVVPPFGVMLLTVTHGWKMVTVTGQLAGTVTMYCAGPPVFG